MNTAQAAAGRRPRSIEIEGVDHGAAPIPMAARVGNMIFTSGIAGKDPRTNRPPADAGEQARLAFANLRSAVEAGGGTVEGIGHVTAFIKDSSVRDALNEAWVAMFPDAADRPARHTLVWDLQGGMLLQLEAVALVADREAEQ
jgi:2-iminobutanoate/2-iminopropanoate deaminase